MELIAGKHGGQTARFPRMKRPTFIPTHSQTETLVSWRHEKATPMDGTRYWNAVINHLRAEHPGNKQGINKALKMLQRFA